MKTEKYRDYQFEIFSHKIPGHLENNNKWVNGYFYRMIKSHSNKTQPFNVIIESNEYFETEQEARFAAIGHITSLENGQE